MTVLRLALAQFDFLVGAVAANAVRMREVTAQARDAGAALVAFPELALCGYPPEDLLLRPGFVAACARELDALAATTAGIAACVGHPHRHGSLFNAASVLRDGAIECTYHKQALPNESVFDEKRYFQAGSEARIVTINGVRVGLLVCEDIWAAAPAVRAKVAGAQLLLVINSSPFDREKQARRETVLTARARQNDVAIAYVNVVGGQDDLLFDGGSLLVDADGRVAARAPQFVDALLLADFDAASGRFTALDWPAATPAPDAAIVYAGLVRGIADYVRKNGFPSVLLGLSGGIDSGLVLALAVDALGAERVCAVMLPSRYTSDLSLREAQAQANLLGVEYRTIPIEPAFEAFNAMLAPAFAGRAPDLTEENLQARSRAVVLMALSNKFGGLVLTTGNKSEVAVGYSTLYGDMCGGYAPLKDVYKTLVWDLARWRNTQGEVIPPVVIERPPSAELRADQTDQQSLPPYPVLDAILEGLVEGDRSRADLVAAGFDAQVVERVARLVIGSEYKRRQSAPGPRITTRAFGRERRYPISSGWR